MIAVLRNFITLVTTVTAVLLAVRELKKAVESFHREPETDDRARPKKISSSKDENTERLCE